MTHIFCNQEAWDDLSSCNGSVCIYICIILCLVLKKNVEERKKMIKKKLLVFDFSIEIRKKFKLVGNLYAFKLFNLSQVD